MDTECCVKTIAYKNYMYTYVSSCETLNCHRSTDTPLHDNAEFLLPLDNPHVLHYLSANEEWQIIVISVMLISVIKKRFSVSKLVGNVESNEFINYCTKKHFAKCYDF